MQEQTANFVTDGMGNDQVLDNTNNQNLITEDILGMNNSLIEDNKKPGTTHIDAKKIPEKFRRAFNKILECEYDGFTYRYKELNFMELLVHGQNPYNIELLRLAGENPEADQDELLKMLEQNPLEKILQLHQLASIRKINILKDSIVEMECDGETWSPPPEYIEAMSPDQVDFLFNKVTREGEADAEAVARFHRQYGSQLPGTGLPSQ